MATTGNEKLTSTTVEDSTAAVFCILTSDAALVRGILVGGLSGLCAGVCDMADAGAGDSPDLVGGAAGVVGGWAAYGNLPDETQGMARVARSTARMCLLNWDHMRVRCA